MKENTSSDDTAAIQSVKVKTFGEDGLEREIKMADKLKVNRKTIQRGLNVLKEKNIIERIGSDRKGFWKVL